MSKYQKSYSNISGKKRYRARKGFARRHIKPLFTFFLLVFLAGGFFYFLFVSSYFKIKHIEVLGIETLSHEEVYSTAENIFAQKKFGFLNSKNYFLAPVEKLRASLLDQFPKLGAISLQKVYHSTLKIQVEERDAAGVWCRDKQQETSDKGQGSSCFYFDKEGVIFEEAPKSSGQLILSVLDARNTESDLGTVMLDEREVVLLQDAKGIIERNFPFGAQAIEIGDRGEFEILTSEGWRVMLNKNEKVGLQLSNLKYVLDEVIKNRRSELEYVDLRLGNKVYYKYRGEEETVDRNSKL